MMRPRPRTHSRPINPRTPPEWVFGYGSLMWRPGFEYLERAEAIVHGYHRAFCVLSHVHRGTPERPGLVLGLDRGGSCRGIAYRVAPERWAEVEAYLRAREQATAVYLDTQVRLSLAGGTGARPAALTFIADRQHYQYAGTLSIEEQARIVLQGHGQSGINTEYLERTVEHMAEIGMRDVNLTAVLARVKALQQAGETGRAYLCGLPARMLW